MSTADILTSVERLLVISRDKQRRHRNVSVAAHWISVARRISVWGCDDEKVITAALFHDVPEDFSHSGYDHQWVEDEYGSDVAAIVWLLTHEPPSGKLDKIRDAVTTRSPFALPAVLIKLADRLDNLSDTPDGLHRRGYVKEAEYLLQIACEALEKDIFTPTLLPPVERGIAALTAKVNAITRFREDGYKTLECGCVIDPADRYAKLAETAIGWRTKRCAPHEAELRDAEEKAGM
jgi:hypothetical protein